MKKGLWALGLALPALGAGLFAEELYRFVFCREGSPLLNRLLEKKGHDEGYYALRESSAAALRQRPCRRYSIRSSRGEELRGFYYPGSGEGRRIAFLVHGYRAEHAEAAGMYYDYYASRGFDLFCCDQTAHGESQGQLIGFGWYEAEDCLQWLDFLWESFGADVQIVLHGFSMGAATVLRMASRCPPCVKCLVEDSGYASAGLQLRGQLGAAYAPLRLLNLAAAGYDPDRCTVYDSLDAARIPILFVHGKDDQTVPFKNGPALYTRYGGPKDCLFTEGTRHVETMYRAPAAYADKLDALIRQSFGKD